jgi:transcriptional regulator NrdR family protein
MESQKEDLSMECPFCGKSESSVIDSRLSKERTAIRRRRKCLDCAGRFTTYEATPEHFLFLLMKQHAAKGASMKSPEVVLAFMTNAFKGLSEGIEKLVDKVEEVETAKKAKKAEKKAPAKIAVKAKPTKRKPAKKKVVLRPVKKTTVTDEVLKIIKRYKKGVDISRLKERTGFADSKLRMIVSRAYKQGKIKRIGRGIYIAA